MPIHVKLEEELFEEYTDENGESQGKFIKTEAIHLVMEHSLKTIEKWEDITKKAFLKDNDKRSEDQKITPEDQILYFKCMVQNMEFDEITDDILGMLTEEHVREIEAYIQKPPGATIIVDERKNNKPNRNVLTAERLYAMMIMSRMPMECANWHINKLLTVLQIISIENTPEKDRKMSKADSASRIAKAKAKRGKR